MKNIARKGYILSILSMCLKASPYIWKFFIPNAEKISELLKECHHRYRIYNDQRSETIFSLLREQVEFVISTK